MDSKTCLHAKTGCSGKNGACEDAGKDDCHNGCHTKSSALDLVATLRKQKSRSLAAEFVLQEAETFLRDHGIKSR